MAYHDNKLNADCLIGQVYNKYSILIGWYDDEGHNEEWVKFEEKHITKEQQKEMCEKAIKSNICPHDCERCARGVDYD